jgi:hypothetical protein
VVKVVDKNEVLLVGENGLGRRLTGVNSLNQTYEKLEDIKDLEANSVLARIG